MWQIRKQAGLHPDRVALIANDEVFTYRQFWRDIAHVYSKLLAMNAPAGRLAIVLCDPLYETWVLVLALRALGLTTFCVKDLAAATQAGLKDVACLVTTHASAAQHGVTASPFPNSMLVRVPPGLFRVRTEAQIADVAPTGVPYGGHILTTSGSTGVTKKLLLSGEQEERRNAARADFFNWSRESRHHGMNFGLWSGAGLKNPLALWQAGASVVFDQGQTIFANVFKHGVTSASWQHNLVVNVLNAHKERNAPVPGFHLIYGASALPSALAQSVLDKISVDVNHLFTSSELCAPNLSAQVTSPDDVFWFTPAPGREVEVVDDAGAPCPVGVEGHLRVKLWDIDCQSYLDDAEASARVFRDGCFYPGDLAVRRADGRIRVLGRVNDVINLLGAKVAAAPLEAQLQKALGLDEVCLFSRQSDAGKSEVIVVMQAPAYPPPDQMRAAAGHFGGIERVHFLAFPAFPRLATDMRKTRREELRRMALAQLDAEVSRQGAG